MMGFKDRKQKQEIKEAEKVALKETKNIATQIKNEFKFTSQIMNQLNAEFIKFGQQNKLIYDKVCKNEERLEKIEKEISKQK